MTTVLPNDKWRLTVVYILAGCLIVIHCLGDGASPGFYKPVLKLTFEVSYNSSNDSVTKGCGKYYAQQFLQFFTRVDDELTSRCRRNGNSGVRVTTFSSARVRLQDSEVELTTYMNISATQRTTTQSNIDSCGTFSKTVLQDLTAHDDVASLRSLHELPEYAGQIDGHNGTVSCTAATMSPLAFTFRLADWLCNGGNVYDNISRHCVVVAETMLSSMSPFAMTSTPLPTEPLQEPTEGSSSLPKLQWGLRVHNTTETLHIAEGEDPQHIIFSAWANTTSLCEGAGEEDCVVSIDVGVIVPTDSLKCRKNGQSVSQLVIGQPKDAPNGEDANFCSIRVYLNDSQEMTSYIPIKAKLDGKYDGNRTQRLTLSLTRRVGKKILQETMYETQVIIEDRDRKATCQSINDPHVTTYDGLEYNNYYEGEFILYRHATLPFRVDVIYQKCENEVLASCNCGVAVQTGDDVIVIDRCYRIKKPFKRLEGVAKDMTRMRTDLYLNDDLTEGTRIFEEADGKKINIYLPHGTYIKVMVSGELLNVWIVASPSDLLKTRGLCGSYNVDPSDDIVLQNGTQLTYLETKSTDRIEPHDFIKDWRVELHGDDSIFGGVEEGSATYLPARYCECEGDALQPMCGFAMDVSTCDMYQGVDKTVRYVVNAKQPKKKKVPTATLR